MNSDLAILPIKTKGERKLNREINSKLPNKHVLCMIIGKINSGKSTLAVNLLANSNFYKGFHDYVFCISQNIHHDPTLQPLKKLYGETCYTDRSVIPEILTFLQGFKKENEDDCNCESPDACLFLDDLLSNGQISQNGMLSSLCSVMRHRLGGRNRCPMLICISQKFNGLPTTVRANANMICLSHTPNQREQKVVLDTYGDYYGGSAQLLKMWMDATNEDHTFLVLMLEGNQEYNHPVAMQDFHTYLFPTSKYSSDRYKNIEPK